ncbi:MAG: pre-peptidase C-terminal domain-containing protein [Thermoanaerobaculia bacterium]
MGFLSKKFKVLVLVLLFLSTTAFSQIMKEKVSYFDNIAFRDFTLGVKTQPQYLQDVINQIPNRMEWKAFTTKFPQAEVYIDQYTGMPALVNNISIPWVSGDPFSPTQISTMALKAKKFIRENIGIFPNLPVDNLVLNQTRSGPFGEDGYLWFVDFDVVYQGVPIEGARVVFRCNHGNLVQFGVEGIMPMADKINVLLNPNPSIDSQAAQEIAFNYAGGFNPKVDTIINQGTLKFLPRLIGNETSGTFIYPLVWEVAFQRAGITGTWTAYVNAHTGDVLSFWDNNRYGTIQGGIYPISPTKTSEVKRPLPYADLGSSRYSNSGGGFSVTSATTSTLAGKYVKISDKCGTISLSSSTSPYNLDFGSSSGTDCTTPGIGGAGNTHSARSCFYHVTNAKLKGMKWLTSNTWLTGQLTANVNINQTCNAYWNGSTINFFRSGGGCGNTGEIAAIFLHEFAHGLDSNDGSPSGDYATGETYGDTYAALLTHDSCIGPGFLSSNCTGYGDSCTSCTGVRDIDYAKHSSGTAHTISNFVFSKCPTDSSYSGPCGKEGHCESYPLSEAMWDLAARDLYSQLGDIDSAWFVFERLFFLTRPTSGSGYSCNTTTKTASGCSTSNWHQTFLVADDNDGNLSNGTPHAQAIYNAFNRHGVACTTSTQTNYGCSAISAPSPTVTAGDSQVTISWSAVTGASKYYILRNDLGCSYGYVKIAETTSTSYTDTEVGNGFTYYYRVVAVGSSAACMSNLSACKQATPAGSTTTYTISGTVTSGGAGLSGVTVTCGSASGTTDTSGNYTTSGLANGTYTCTPTKSGYTFTPASTNVTISGANVTGINFTATAQSTDTQLTSGVGVSGSVAKGEWKYYYITVPSGATSLVIATTNATGDVDLYTQYNAKPTSSSYACRPYTSSGNETCTHSNPSAGTWWAGVYGYAAGSYTITATVTTSTTTYTISGTITSGGTGLSGVTVSLTGAASKTTTTDTSGNYSFTGLANGTYKVTPSKTGCTFSPSYIDVTISGANQTGKNFTATCTTSDVQLSNGVGYNDSVTQGAWKYYYITVPTGVTSLEIKTTNATGDVDLYTQYNAKPTSSSYACRPYTSSGNETCTHSSPSAGTWWAGVYGYAAGSYTITATYTTSSGGTIIQATYNSTYKAPMCSSVGAGCEATSTLLKCRDSIGPEPNQPNTINGSCADGTSGTCYSDESIESIKVATTDGQNLAVGKTVNVTVQAYCYGTADRVTLFYATNGTSPTWTKVGSTQTCSSSGLKTFTWSLTLSGTAGSTQAVRAQITYNVDPGTTTCYTGSYNDRDDLIFKLQQ